MDIQVYDFAQQIQDGQWFGYEYKEVRYLCYRSNESPFTSIISSVPESQLASILLWAKEQLPANHPIIQELHDQNNQYSDLCNIVWKVMSAAGFIIPPKIRRGRKPPVLSRENQEKREKREAERQATRERDIKLQSYLKQLLPGEWCGYQNEDDKKRRFLQREHPSTVFDARMVKRGRIAETFPRSQLQEILNWAKARLPLDHLLHQEIESQQSTMLRKELVDLIWRTMSEIGLIFTD